MIDNASRSILDGNADVKFDSMTPITSVAKAMRGGPLNLFSTNFGTPSLTPPSIASPIIPIPKLSVAETLAQVTSSMTQVWILRPRIKP